MKVVVLAGPESSGKSWLAAELQAHFGGLMVGEYVRYFIDHYQRDTTLADIPAIARGQLGWEDAARAQQPRLLILDLHLLLSPEDVEWTADGQRCQPELADRRAFFQGSLDWLQQHRQPVVVIRGDWQARRDKAFAAVEQLLQKQAGSLLQ